MSCTPKVKNLSSKQLDKTLSAKKKPQKTIKNILSSKSLEWPILENPSSLFKEMSSLGINLKKDDSQEPTDEDTRKWVLFGINQIEKCLKKQECITILFDSNVPKILIAHLYNIANEQNIPTILVSGLQKFLLGILGFNSSSICFKTGNDRFTNLLKIIENHHKHSGSRKIEFDDTLNSTSKMNEEIPMDVEPSDTICDLDQSFVVYLKRPDDGTRAFNPPSSKSNLLITKPKVHSEMFIGLDEKKSKPKDNKKSFNPLYIKRIQNNVGRRNKKK